MNKLPSYKRIEVLRLLLSGFSVKQVREEADVAVNTITDLLIKEGQRCIKINASLKISKVNEVLNLSKRNIFKTKLVLNEGLSEEVEFFTYITSFSQSKFIIEFFSGYDRKNVLGNLGKMTFSRLESLDLYGIVANDKMVDKDELDLFYGFQKSKASARIISFSGVDLSAGLVGNKIRMHDCAFALHSTYHNFCNVLSDSLFTPAMLVGQADRVYSMEELFNFLEMEEL